MLLGVALAGCAQRPFAPTSGPSRGDLLAAMPVLSPDRVLPADRGGVSPADTTVRYAAALGRTIVLRHAPPDNAVFATLVVPPDSGSNDSVSVTLRATPGRYGLTMQASRDLPTGTTLTFSYAIHFLAPPEVPSASYPTVTRYADWLGIIHAQGNGMRFLQATRPGADQLRAPVTVSGEYLVGAPVTPP